jgi:hypothetical protein
LKITKPIQVLLDAIDARTHLIVGRTTGEIARRFSLTDEQVEETMGAHAGVRKTPCRLWGYLPGQDAYHCEPEEMEILGPKGFYSDDEMKEISREVDAELAKRAKERAEVKVEKVVEAPIKSKKIQKMAKQIFKKFPKDPQVAPAKPAPGQDKPFDLTRFLK